ncbi:hypothetical protein [Luteimonas deserti]|uniref:Uncharacterized protein n=1 Tax=Luteimonas deserti TaxID=2752306 RepID=A0A7Z0TWG7_9GAMM|nr:hypothetical protein [Luteimonas deserti]NYZ63349.1 hypothetical protein [Luteimonas deserti]
MTTRVQRRAGVGEGTQLEVGWTWRFAQQGLDPVDRGHHVVAPSDQRLGTGQAAQQLDGIVGRELRRFQDAACEFDGIGRAAVAQHEALVDPFGNVRHRRVGIRRVGGKRRTCEPGRQENGQSGAFAAFDHGPAHLGPSPLRAAESSGATVRQRRRPADGGRTAC